MRWMRWLAAWVGSWVACGALAANAASGSNGPFAIVDKARARIAVYDADGRLVGSAPVLLGLAPGDKSFPDTASKTAAGRLPPSERTTPAGRYASMPGVNLHGERIVWIDYANALAIHRLRPSPAHERRAERLASPSPEDHRITMGCVVVEPSFFDRVIAPTLGRSRGMVVVLPEALPPEP